MTTRWPCAPIWTPSSKQKNTKVKSLELQFLAESLDLASLPLDQTSADGTSHLS